MHSGSFICSLLSSIVQISFVILLLIALSHVHCSSDDSNNNNNNNNNNDNNDDNGDQYNNNNDYYVFYTGAKEEEDLEELIRQEALEIFGLNFTVPAHRFPRGWVREFSNWKPPRRYKRAFPNFLSGFDYENQPIWIAEWGKYDFREFLHGNVTRNLEKYEKYSRWCFFVMVLSTGIKSTEEQPVEQFTALLDFHGFKIDHGFTSVKITRWLVSMSDKLRKILEENFAYAFAVNVNPVAEIFTNFVRSIFGKISDRFEVLGTDKKKWAPKILRKFPRNQIPPAYSGCSTQVPLVNIG